MNNIDQVAHTHLLNIPSSQQLAINILSKFIEIYGGVDGTGLFSGINRYSYLEDRCKLSAIQSNDLRSFWSRLCNKLGCPINLRKHDESLLLFWSSPEPDQAEILKYLREQTGVCIVIARSLKPKSETETSDTIPAKRSKKKNKAAQQNDSFNDPLNDPLPELI
jgi:hypothetical protein